MKLKGYLLVAVLCLIIAGLVFPAGCSDEGVTAATAPVNSGSDTRIYNNYGIIFEYPKGWTISEMGMLQS